jgi:multisubunit Na+/H+ antiporter MnhF subunit
LTNVDASTVVQRFQYSLAVVTLVLSAGVILWVLARLARSRVDRHLVEFNTIAGATGCSLAVLKYLASPETRHELEALSTVGNALWLTSCLLAVVLHRMHTRDRVGH